MHPWKVSIEISPHPLYILEGHARLRYSIHNGQNQCTLPFLSFISSSSNPLAGPSLLSTRFASVLSDLANSRTPPPCVSRLPWRCLQVSRAKNEHLISLVDLLVHIDVEIFLHCMCDLERCSLYRYDQNQGQYLLVYGHLILFVVTNINVIFRIGTILYVQALVL